MRLFDTTTRLFALRIGLPAIVLLLATFAIVLLSLARMADDVNTIEGKLTEREATAAIQSVRRHFGETAQDYSQWDDAVRNLYGDVNIDWVNSSIVSSTGEATLFDTFYLVDERGNGVLAYRNGEPVSATPIEAFGRSLTSMIAELPSDGKTFDVRTGIVKGAWGLAIIAVSPVVPITADFPLSPRPTRFLVIGKAFDGSAVTRLGEDFVIEGLHLVDPATSAPLKVNLVDTSGTVVGALAWSPGQLGSKAGAQVGPVALTMLLLVGAMVVFLVGYALHGWKAVQKGKLQLDAALDNMAHGLCMFDAGQRLVTFNRRFTEIFHILGGDVAPGMSMRQVMKLAQQVDENPEAARAAQRGLLADPSSGSVVTTLTDGRIISISHRAVANGGVVATFEDITERRQAEERVRHLAHYDALTDLPNRVLFHKRMKSVLSRFKRSETVAILRLDIDDFKNVNDLLGHPVGDLLLRAAADRMRSCVRGEHTLARLGGDEFAVLQVQSANSTDVTSLATRLIEVVAAPYDFVGRQVVVGVSIGIALAPTDGSDPDTLMKNADLALYRAKADGRNLYRFFELAMAARMRARRTLDLDFRRAIVDGAFELVYQPIVSVKTRQVTSCEALVRWRHPERGIVMPAEFIPIAEETGLIVPLGEWVLRQACAEAARWPKSVAVAVNLSPAQFKSRDLLPAVVCALAASGLEPSRLQLEITELVLMRDND